mmetsp:Transcript_2785/g.4699  ORF Transcript_2785/g.4699 Transcript_2785/m.4699 type:complete len:260 (+) Transcript_2785:2081-2860(+)
MQVPFERVAEARGVVVFELLEHVDEVARHGPEVLHRARHVLNEHAGAGLARAAHDGDEALAHVPEELAHFPVPEGVLVHVVREHCVGLLQRVYHLIDVGLKHVGLLAAAFDQQSRAFLIAKHQPVHLLDHAVVGLALAQARRVEHLHRVNARLLAQHIGRLARRLHRGEHHERRRLVSVIRHGVVGGAGHKGESAFRADHEALDDLDGVRHREVHERIETVPGGALDRILAANQGSQLLIRLDPPGDLHDSLNELLVCL